MKNQSHNLISTIRVAIFNQHSEVLFLKKSNVSKNPGMFELPGGKVEDNSLEHAARKEVLEETGLEINDLAMISEISPFHYSFEVAGVKNFRKVYFFKTILDVDKSDFETQFIKVLSLSTHEDKHDGFLWIRFDKLLDFQLEISHNSIQILRLL